MTRYAIAVDDIYVAACYEPVGSGIRFTEHRDDACSYVTIDKACSVAKDLMNIAGLQCCIVEVAH
jgi:hypothetical protein